MKSLLDRAIWTLALLAAGTGLGWWLSGALPQTSIYALLGLLVGPWLYLGGRFARRFFAVQSGVRHIHALHWPKEVTVGYISGPHDGPDWMQLLAGNLLTLVASLRRNLAAGDSPMTAANWQQVDEHIARFGEHARGNTWLTRRNKARSEALYLRFTAASRDLAELERLCADFGKPPPLP